MIEDEDLLLAVLNSAPVIDGNMTETLAGTGGAALARSFGGTGSTRELANLRQLRASLQDMVRERSGAGGRLETLLSGVVLTPRVADETLSWEIRASKQMRLVARTAMTWSRVSKELPGRLHACANVDCNLFLIDHSRPGTAKWCSMATCGNRMKARTHAERQRTREL